MENSKIIKQVCDFLSSIGIETREGKIEDTSFLPGIEILKGSLVFEKRLLTYPGDLLHEAGHIAVRPRKERSRMNYNVTATNPEKAGEEIAVLLWSYAAIMAIGAKPEIVFHKNGYKGESEWILNNFDSRRYVGLPLLIWMGLTKNQHEPDGFPKMLKWLRD